MRCNTARGEFAILNCALRTTPSRPRLTDLTVRTKSLSRWTANVYCWLFLFTG